MKQYNLANLVSRAETALVSYLASSLPVGNHRNQTKLGERFLNLWQSETFKGPYLESLPQYVRTCKLSQMAVSPDFSSPKDKLFFSRMQPIHDWKSIDINPRLTRFVRARRQLWKEGTTEAADEMEKSAQFRVWDRVLYLHQRQAFDAVAKLGKHAVVATGTGSGKTECFLLPLLHELLSEPDQLRIKPGVRAILLYPMNALVEDQMSRLSLDYSRFCWRKKKRCSKRLMNTGF